MGDAGDLNGDGTVTAACGVRFRPIDLPGNCVSLPGYPPDPDLQTPPHCAIILVPVIPC